MVQVMAEMQRNTQAVSRTLEAVNTAIGELQARGSPTGGSEKIIQKPDLWRPASMEEEMTTWPEWSFLFRAYIEFHVPAYSADLDHVEGDLTSQLDFNDYSTVAQERSQKLYTILCSYVKGRPLRIVRSAPLRDGFRAWQLLCKEYQPATRNRSLAIAQAILAFPAFERGRHLDGLLNLERLIEDFERISNTKYPDELKISTLLHVLLNHLRQHLQLNMSESTTYAQLRTFVLRTNCFCMDAQQSFATVAVTFDQ